MNSIIPTPRCPIQVRLATNEDIPFIDGLQKMHSHMVGWMPGKQLEGKIKLGQIVIAEETRGQSSEVRGQQNAVPLGYCISSDQYSGRDDVGIIYQLNVMPIRQRHLIGATLIKAVFERAAYGCRLFCCWCAQDIQANYFWESIGFVPLAFRTGSASKQRIHIFWQRRIRAEDQVTPYWFPSQTKSGAVREDRLVLPIPTGMHWRDLMPVILPKQVEADADAESGKPLTLPGGGLVCPRPEQPRVSTAHRMAVMRSQSKHLQGVPVGKAAVVTSGGLRYIDRGDHVPEPEAPKAKRAPKPRAKNDPKHVAAARELRDRYLEQINTQPLLGNGKYDVSRALEAPGPEHQKTSPPQGLAARVLPAPMAA